MRDGEIHAESSIVVDAEPAVVYGLITDVSLWPVIFQPTIHTRVLEHSAAGDRFEIWATVANGVSNWHSHREFDPVSRRVTFGQGHDEKQFGFMGGRWSCVAAQGGRTEVVLHHRYNPPPDDPEVRRRIARGLDENAEAELAALRTIAVLPGGVDRWMLTFADSVRLTGSPDAAREFLWEASRWPERLPHVASMDVVELPGDGQDMTMRTRMADGSVHTTRSVRVRLPDGSLAYKQTRPPSALLGHSGRWEFLVAEGGASWLRSTHTILLNPDLVAESFGASASPDEAASGVRAALSANSRTTMEHAARFAAALGAIR